MPEFDATIQYRDVPGFNGYKVGTDGSMWTSHNNRWGPSSKWREMKQTRIVYGKSWYRTVSIKNSETGKIHSKKVHILVALAFYGPRTEGQEVLHDNGDGEDNALSNLRYGTRKDNEKDKIRHGRTNRGERNGQAILKADQVRAIRLLGSAGHTKSSIGRQFGVDRKTVEHILIGKLWKHLD